MKKLLVIFTVLLSSVELTGCGNRRLIDTTYTYRYAIIELPNGEIIEGNIDSWADDDNSDAICVRINGIDYYTTSNNATLMSRKPN